MRHFPSFILLVCLVAFAGACGSKSSPTSPSAVAFTQTDLRLGTGDAAATGNSLTVNYTGWLYDATRPDFKGQVFDTNVGGTALTFTLGAQQVIEGWDKGLVGLRVGGVRRLIIPASMAYGSVRYGYIPPNTPLVFDVELLSLKTSS